MKFVVFGVVAGLALGSIGLAQATPVNLVQNGDFSQTTKTLKGPTQFGSKSGGPAGSGCGAWGGQLVSGWTGNSGYMIWYDSAKAASTVSANTQFGCSSTQRLPSAITAPPAGPGNFIAMDGDNSNGYAGQISQTIHGLTVGRKYVVSFYWGSTQEMSRSGPTTEQLKVSLGSQSFMTKLNSIGTHGWSGWAPVSFTFTAQTASSILKFFSVGGPTNLPPMAVLADITMVAAPEPPTLALFGGGLLGLGVLTLVARRRAQKDRDTGDGTAV